MSEPFGFPNSPTTPPNMPSAMPPPPPPGGFLPPPGYVAYGGNQYAQPAANIGTLTKWLVALMSIGLVAQLLSLGVQFSLRNKAQEVIDDVISSSRFNDSLGMYIAISLLAGVAALAQVVVLIIWTFRLGKNAEGALRRKEQMKFGRPGITIVINLLGNCTLGILNFLMWRELWQASDPESPAGDPSWRQRPVAAIVNVYFALTIAGTAVGLALGVSGAFGGIKVGTDSTQLADQLSGRFGILALSGLFTIAASVAFILMIRQLAARHMRATGEIA